MGVQRGYGKAIIFFFFDVSSQKENGPSSFFARSPRKENAQLFMKTNSFEVHKLLKNFQKEF